MCCSIFGFSERQSASQTNLRCLRVSNGKIVQRKLPKSGTEYSNHLLNVEEDSEVVIVFSYNRRGSL